MTLLRNSSTSPLSSIHFLQHEVHLLVLLLCCVCVTILMTGNTSMAATVTDPNTSLSTSTSTSSSSSSISNNTIIQQSGLIATSVPVPFLTTRSQPRLPVPYRIEDERSICSKKCTEGEECVPTLSGTRKCCRQCGPGEGMAQLCTGFNETECRPCQTGQEYSDVLSALEKCRPCTLCSEIHPQAVQVKECTATSDTQCRCPNNWFYSAQEFTCKQCSACNSSGEVLVKNCTAFHDSVCRTCPPAHFLKRGVCLPCTTCTTSTQEEVIKCGLTRDTVCCPKRDLKCRENAVNPMKVNSFNEDDPALNKPSATAPSSSGHGERDWRQFLHPGGNLSLEGNPSASGMKPPPTSEQQQTNVRTASEFIPLYCAIMGLIIFVLMIYVVYTNWTRYRQSKGSGNKKGHGSSLPMLRCASPGNGVITTALLMDGNPVPPPNGSIMGTRNGGYTPLSMQNERGPSITSNKSYAYYRHDHRKLSSLPETTLVMMKEALAKEDGGNGWRALAKELGYSPAEVYAISTPNSVTYSGTGATTTSPGSTATTNSDFRPTIECVDALLRDWTVRDTATVSSFIRALHRVHQSAVIALLKLHLQQEHEALGGGLQQQQQQQQSLPTNHNHNPSFLSNSFSTPSAC